MEEGYFWCSLFILEAIIVVVLNLFTIIVFTKDRKVRKRSTYLLINLSAADMGVGGLVIPTSVFRRGNTFGFWNVEITPAWFISTHGVDTLFFGCSLAFLVSISVERLHATRNPMGHRSMSGLSYKIWMSCIWVASFIYTTIVVLFLYYDIIGTQVWYIVASCVFGSLLILSCSYCGIFVTVRCSEQPQHAHRGQAQKERRFTMTLFIVTLVSLSVWIPYVLFTFLESHLSEKLSAEALLRTRGVCEALFFANSFVNPILYTIRMPQFRKASIRLITCARHSGIGQISLSSI
ncbi:sphingosine 1-phosphate receptor 1-like [Oculina patagonica]